MQAQTVLADRCFVYSKILLYEIAQSFSDLHELYGGSFPAKPLHTDDRYVNSTWLMDDGANGNAMNWITNTLKSAVSLQN